MHVGKIFDKPGRFEMWDASMQMNTFFFLSLKKCYSLEVKNGLDAKICQIIVAVRPVIMSTCF